MKSAHKEPVYQFTTKSFSSNPVGTIAIATVLGLSLTFLSVALGMSVYFSMLMLFSGILVVYGFKTGSITYAIHEEGIAQTISEYLPHLLGKKPYTRFISWSDIRSFRNDKDFQRSLTQYEYLKLYLKRAPGEIWITNQRNAEGFYGFKAEFLRRVEQKVNQLKAGSNSGTEMRDSSLSSHKIVRKQSFYESVAAKFFTILLIGLCLFIGYLSVVKGLRPANWMKLLLIVVPGTIYMVYRVFIKTSKEKGGKRIEH